ncbi:MAG: hypothetical protein ACOX6K_02695 [Sphaerochaetaceae bacterium]|jgi:hypothetical protein
MKDAFSESLVSNAAESEAREKLKLYVPLIGLWEFDWTGNVGGREITVPGEWIFSWILEGRAIQDTWICPARKLRNSGDYPQGEYGTTIRVFDAVQNMVKVFWFGPTSSNFSLFEARWQDGRIVQDEILDGHGPATRRERWIFRDISEDSFVWESLKSSDGEQWNVTQTVLARKK